VRRILHFFLSVFWVFLVQSGLIFYIDPGWQGDMWMMNSRTGARGGGAKPAWTANTKGRKVVDTGEMSPTTGLTGGSFGAPRVNARSRKMMAGRTEATAGDLVNRLHALHEQRNDRLDALRQEVERQRFAKEEAELNAHRFRATPSKRNGGRPADSPSAAEVVDRLHAFDAQKRERIERKREDLKAREVDHGFTFRPALSRGSKKLNKTARAVETQAEKIERMHEWELQKRERIDAKRQQIADAEMSQLASMKPKLAKG
jgi:hypothetical protein